MFCQTMFDGQFFNTHLCEPKLLPNFCEFCGIARITKLTKFGVNEWNVLVYIVDIYFHIINRTPIRRLLCIRVKYIWYSREKGLEYLPFIYFRIIIKIINVQDVYSVYFSKKNFYSNDQCLFYTVPEGDENYKLLY